MKKKGKIKAVPTQIVQLKTRIRHLLLDPKLFPPLLKYTLDVKKPIWLKLLLYDLFLTEFDKKIYELKNTLNLYFVFLLIIIKLQKYKNHNMNQ